MLIAVEHQPGEDGERPEASARVKTMRAVAGADRADDRDDDENRGDEAQRRRLVLLDEEAVEEAPQRRPVRAAEGVDARDVFAVLAHGVDVAVATRRSRRSRRRKRRRR